MCAGIAALQLGLCCFALFFCEAMPIFVDRSFLRHTLRSSLACCCEPLRADLLPSLHVRQVPIEIRDPFCPMTTKSLYSMSADHDLMYYSWDCSSRIASSQSAKQVSAPLLLASMLCSCVRACLVVLATCQNTGQWPTRGRSKWLDLAIRTTCTTSVSASPLPVGRPWGLV